MAVAMDSLLINNENLIVCIAKNQGSTFGKGLSDFFMGGGEKPLDRASGDPHLGAGLFLEKSLQITETQGFQFILLKVDLCQFPQRYPGGLKGSVANFAFAVSSFLGSWHKVSPELLNFFCMVDTIIIKNVLCICNKFLTG